MLSPAPRGQQVVGAGAGRDHSVVWELGANTGKLQEVSVTKALAGITKAGAIAAHRTDGRLLPH